MKNKNFVKYGLLLVTICLLMSGCSGIVQTDGILKDDFDIEYNGIIINENTPIEELSKLDIPINEANDNITIKASSKVKDMSYNWYIVHYPSIENEEITIEYIYNETNNTGYIVFANLFKVPTKRGIAIGDHYEKIKELYGGDIFIRPSTSTTNYANVKMENKRLTFIYETSTDLISKIYIDYNLFKATEEMQITAFK